MKTFALRRGDLVLSGSSYAMVDGAARVQQHLGLALREPFGSDRFAMRWGSILPDMIGSVISSSITDDIRAEVIRVIRNHLMVQAEQLRSKQAAGQKAVLTPSEVITNIDDLRIQQVEDRVLVKIALRTAGSQQISVLAAPGGS